ncbi:hypothetical protein [Chromohalobacter nigrandesensis]|uniref:hypothetical protein n=1 Tax=Chromohalobacter nigrandesensis TaxID=119863 RepID=UPI001FF2843B|nr:hypothetical protein [Chromohalobacter nigrandesensis]MCK0746233.1 hypothetical protein [Chromohalobacter nigrandesensis]
MSNVIAQLAKTQPPKELLQHIDINDIYEKFHETFKRLDDFKDIRDKHEQRGFLGRLFNGKELKDAQLDAHELQAEFSKTLAQLMMISTMQSQQLVAQQNQLGQQQGDLKEKAESLANHTRKLEEHQNSISQQATELRQYVTNLLNVQGLTAEHGQQLIDIAEEVTATKDRLLEEFTARVQEIDAALVAQQESSQAEIDRVHAELQERLAVSERHQLEKQQHAESRQAQRQEALTTRLEQIKTTLEETTRADIATLRGEIETQKADFLSRQSSLSEAISQARQELQAQLDTDIAKTHETLSRQIDERTTQSDKAITLLRTELGQLHQQQRADAKAQRRRIYWLWAGMTLLAIAGGIGIAYPYLPLNYLA